MGTKSNNPFDDFIKTQAKKSVAFDKDKELNQWRGQVESFYKQIKGFLDRYITDETVRLEFKKQAMHEELLGAYEVDSLTLFIGANRIKFTPIGAMIIGAKGRIDMTGPRGSVTFVLVDKDSTAPKISVRVWISGQNPPPEDPPKTVHEWAWKISTPPPKIKYTELEEEAFQTALMEVVNG